MSGSGEYRNSYSSWMMAMVWKSLGGPARAVAAGIAVAGGWVGTISPGAGEA